MPQQYATDAYTDLDLNFGKNIRTGDVNILSNEVAIKRSLYNLVMTRNGERHFHPEVGCMVHNLLFDPMTPITTIAIKRTITDTINNFEPRVNLHEVQVLPDEDNNRYVINILFYMLNKPEVMNSTIILDRIR